MAATQDRTLGIYVKGIAEDCAEDDLTSAFGKFGEIIEVIVQNERGWALVHYGTAAEAAAAAAGGVTSVGGADVEVSARTPAKVKEVKAVPATTNIYLSGLEETTTEEEVTEALEKFGDVASVKLQGARGFAFATMEDLEAAVSAVAGAPLQVGGLEGVGCEMRRSRAPASKSPNAGGDAPAGGIKKKKPRKKKDLSKDIYIKGLVEETAEDSNEEDLLSIFGEYGTVVSVMLRKGRDFAFVQFEDESSVAKAVAASGMAVKGNSVIVEARTGTKPTTASEEAQ
jgi:RNA recognition motif-containing protein